MQDGEDQSDTVPYLAGLVAANHPLIVFTGYICVQTDICIARRKVFQCNRLFLSLLFCNVILHVLVMFMIICSVQR